MMLNRIFREQWKIQKKDATIEGIRGYERTKIGTSKKLASNLGVGREQKGKTWVIWGMTGKPKRAMCVNDAHGGHEKKKKRLKKDRKVRGAVTQHTAYIAEAPRGAQHTISLCSDVPRSMTLMTALVHQSTHVLCPLIIQLVLSP
jgi:hypothetical protein